MVEAVTMGIVLGLSAGFAPGPLLALVISETLRHDIRAGIKVAISPLFTDLPIIVLTLLVLSQLSGFKSILGTIAMIGGGVIMVMGYDSMVAKPVAAAPSASEPQSLLKGILANALSPHPYLFWFGVGGPIIARTIDQGMATPFSFIVNFYIFLVGSKISLAVLVGRSKSFLSGPVYRTIMRLLGLALCVLALLLFRDGLRLLGVIQSR